MNRTQKKGKDLIKIFNEGKKDFPDDLEVQRKILEMVVEKEKSHLQSRQVLKMSECMDKLIVRFYKRKKGSLKEENKEIDHLDHK
ncbi:Spo0E family sporulation regulatory protein-aspartic acid phosphatase [Candidatus Formimonas warabiya]|uniref:Uncharacterized protein n=1 Tax=Formimonas warabiya TaxID=1761012 RepID=A0A3G1KQ07_FORW1|nr:Spo0E family sporulation regulatory protein-aspartic acid phosphatase [Candidatus Formimonas warabiya]ATW24552.1 hypothetical protein DCMF_06930 [Candidatus Formimonas warabiya]